MAHPLQDIFVALVLLAAFVGAEPAVSAAAQTPPTTTASGADLYRDCAACHGPDGGGVADGTVPAIGGQPAAVIARQLANFRAGRRQDLRMRHFADDDHLEGSVAVGSVALYVAGLRRVTPTANGSGKDLAAGQREFALRCASCHGAGAAAVVSMGVPALAGQHATYLERKLQEAAAGLNSIGATHRAVASKLAPENAAAIADWLSRQP
jgi:cytochrome c553